MLDGGPSQHRTGEAHSPLVAIAPQLAGDWSGPVPVCAAAEAKIDIAATPVLLRPQDAPAPSSRIGFTARTVLAVGASLMMHAGVLAAVLQVARDRTPLGDDVEIPIEVVIEQGRDAAPGDAETAVSERQAQPAERTEVASVAAPAPAVEPEPSPEKVSAPPPAPEPTPQAASVPPAAPMMLAALPPSADDPHVIAAREREEQEAERRRERAERERQRAQEQARERQRERQRERAREQAQERAQERIDERKRELAARREAERAARKRDEARMASAAGNHGEGADVSRSRGDGARPAQAARAGEGDGFDAASYRALIARAVRAAIGSRCADGAGSRVVIALAIGRTGAISGASVASSSGNGAFDAASVAAVRRAGPFPAPTGRAGVSVPVAVACK